MKPLFVKLAPFSIGAGLVLLLGAVLLAQSVVPMFAMVERLEWMTYDWRVRQSLRQPTAATGNLGAVAVDERTLQELNESRGYRWPLPRHLYGHVVRELNAQGAAGVLFDIFFLDLDDREKQPKLPLVGGGTLGSDAYFAQQIGRAGNVILSVPTGPGGSLILPAEVFRSKAAALGHAARDADSDGVLRRVRPFVDDPVAGRVWQGGIVLAARHLGLDLASADVKSGSITLQGRDGAQIKLPLDHDGRLLVHWSLPLEDRRVQYQNLLSVLGASGRRATGKEVPAAWNGRLVVIGSTGVGSNVSDVGATPLAKDGFLFSAMWNVANSVLSQSFVKELGRGWQVLLLAGMTALTGLLSWRLRALWATLAVAALAIGYGWFACWAYVRFRLWLPLVLPLAGSLLMTHSCMVVFRMILERGHRRRYRSVFEKIVSPDIEELVREHPDPSLGTTQKTISVLFADIRKFTEFTDQQLSLAHADVARGSLTGLEAEECYKRYANATVETVNLYLSAVVEAVENHKGSLDKYAGDSVMAFWGAPEERPDHAAAAVRAAIHAQRAVAEINAARSEENDRIETQNRQRAATGGTLLPTLPVLTIGTGVNTGVVTVGLMGAERHLSNYTVFGREVNIASRLEGVSGSKRVIVSEATREAVALIDPGLASTFRSLDAVPVKGIATPVRIFEVPWQDREVADSPEKLRLPSQGDSLDTRKTQ